MPNLAITFQCLTIYRTHQNLGNSHWMPKFNSTRIHNEMTRNVTISRNFASRGPTLASKIETLFALLLRIIRRRCDRSRRDGAFLFGHHLKGRCRILAPGHVHQRSIAKLAKKENHAWCGRASISSKFWFRIFETIEYLRNFIEIYSYAKKGFEKIKI